MDQTLYIKTSPHRIFTKPLEYACVGETVYIYKRILIRLLAKA